MNNDIYSLIDSANEQLKQLGLADATIKTYQQRTFSQIIRRYEKEGDYQYRQEIMNELLFEAEKQSPEKQETGDAVASKYFRKSMRKVVFSGNFVMLLFLPGFHMFLRTQYLI